METATRQWFALTPVDSWFIGGGQPNNMGEDQVSVTSMFPPPGPTVVGAVRAAVARWMGWRGGPWPLEVKQQLGDGDDLGPLDFMGPFLIKEWEGRRDTLYPAPANLVGTMEEGRWIPADVLAPASIPTCTDLAVEPLRLPKPAGLSVANARLKPADGIWLTARGVSAALSGGLPDVGECCMASDLVVYEQRVGLAKDAVTRTAKEGGLYSPVHVRLRRGVSVVVGVSGLPEGFALPLLLSFGGESRLAHVESVDPPSMPVSSFGVTDVRTIVLTTPGRLLNGAEVEWEVPGPGAPASSLVETMSGTIESVCLGRPLRIGGWDSVAGAPRPLEPYVPAGTVWFVRDADGLPDSLSVGTRTAFGFGQAMTGQPPTDSIQ